MRYNINVGHTKISLARLLILLQPDDFVQSHPVWCLYLHLGTECYCTVLVFSQAARCCLKSWQGFLSVFHINL
nr:MAG TPA: hypothetical protein [Caudoviricetes sp.]